ncbi:hypothetical protein PV04_09379 [Phialophora macrospora]|uniref:Alpha-1,3-mannosyltransferase n=1 Tax=Phialophora macrospora TaxID=1851006 RepID=A0A0D2DQF2_9EURO|nr:hypothetical protein PV04_09379 [Phialophora macrospora]
MPPHLHPRSTATSTLFAGTLLASFIVVGIPHVFPCPRPRTGYAADAGRVEFDEDGKPIGRKPRSKASNASGDPEARKGTQRQPPARQKGLNQTKDIDEEAALFRELAAEAEMLERQAKMARECPVPKPTGWVGRILGFEDQREAGVSGGREKG